MQSPMPDASHTVYLMAQNHSPEWFVQAQKQSLRQIMDGAVVTQQPGEQLGMWN